MRLQKGRIRKLSHTITLPDVKLSIEATIKAAQKLGWQTKESNTVRFHDGRVATGLSVQIPGWQYSVVITLTGEVIYDNYYSNWGRIEELAKLSGLAMIAMSDHSLDEVEIKNTEAGMEFVSADPTFGLQEMESI